MVVSSVNDISVSDSNAFPRHFQIRLMVPVGSECIYAEMSDSDKNEIERRLKSGNIPNLEF